MHELLRRGVDATQHAHDELHEDRFLYQSFTQIESEGLQVTDVVALEFEARTELISEFLEDPLDIGKGILEHHVPRAFEEPGFPVMLPFAVAPAHRKQAEVHRTHIQRTHFRLRGNRRRQPFVERHDRAAAGRNIDDGIAALADLRQELHEHFGVCGRMPGCRVACM